MADKMIGEFRLHMTCGSYPEQYDVYLKDKQVGYLRLRNGIFRVIVPDVDGKVIFKACPDGDGEFNDDEREKYLSRAVRCISKFLNDARG